MKGKRQKDLGATVSQEVQSLVVFIYGNKVILVELLGAQFQTFKI